MCSWTEGVGSGQVCKAEDRLEEESEIGVSGDRDEGGLSRSCRSFDAFSLLFYFYL